MWLTASFSGAPAGHDGTSPFELEFALTEEPRRLSYLTVQSARDSVKASTARIGDSIDSDLDAV